MKTLNFFPYYEPYLRTGKKTTTFRVSKNRPFQKGQEVVVTIGWDETKTAQLGLARIQEVYSRAIKELQARDFKGESPDCKSNESTKLVLGSIYRSVLNDEDKIWVVKFEHIAKKKGNSLCSS